MGRLIAALVLLVLSVAPVRAAGPDTLTPEIKRHIAALTPLRGAGAREAFDGRPILVKFFASY